VSTEVDGRRAEVLLDSEVLVDSEVIGRDAEVVVYPDVDFVAQVGCHTGVDNGSVVATAAMECHKGGDCRYRDRSIGLGRHVNLARRRARRSSRKATVAAKVVVA